MTFASVNDMKTVLEFIFAGMAVVGIFTVAVAVFFAMLVLRTCLIAPLPDEATDKLLQELHSDIRWKKPTPSPYDLSKVGGLKGRS